ncbi:YitT family protein [Pseudoruegeria sp. SK021]|uniref:YitT family protein n=1 Tax=Pseudoruegeria sp. SK021 TaxID=1933035 RepID=UPI000A222F17|nr:YitT family protein [Pseudoruegeria sp. SK021]OSP55577.1 membrane protein [Pseudoruegeria sp. SK021]
MPASVPIPVPHTVRHTPLEDLQGLSIGVLLSSFGIVLLAQLGFFTGQTAGIALIVSYVTGLPFGWVFFTINLPFYWLAKQRLGWEFTLKSLGCVAALSVLTEAMPHWVSFNYLNPYLGALLFGVMVGLGLLALFRHKGSMGGIGVVALMIQDSTGFKAGYVQFIVDAIIFTVALFLFDTRVVLFSLLGAICLNGVITFNHRRDRYIAP